MIATGSKKRTWEMDLIDLLSCMTFDERVRFMMRFANARRKCKLYGKLPPRFWLDKKHHYRAV